METSILIRRLQEYDSWRRHIVQILGQVAEFSKRLNLLPGGMLLRLETMARDVLGDQLRLSFYGEFARGKSELINALFFHDQGKRLLPSGPGQTTMSPVEIRTAGSGPAFMELLPVQTRTLRGDMEHLRKLPEIWNRFPLKFQDPGSTAGEILRHLTDTICVPLQEARQYGLCPPLDGSRLEISRCPTCGDGKVRISRWRYALLQMNHPVLDAGLVILDTPGLNALGSEFDLGLEAARKADALIFVLGADTGVTHSDLQIWEQALGGNSRLNQLVVLNKIDALWDDSEDPERMEQAIERQCAATAERLSLRKEQVMAVSARRGLAGRMRGEDLLVASSRIPALETAIAEILLPGKREAIRDGAGRLLKRIFLDQKTLLEEQIQAVHGELESMHRLEAQTGEQLPQLLERQKRILLSLAGDRLRFAEAQKKIMEDARGWLLESLSLDVLEEIIQKARAELLAAWTTLGIYERFSRFFADTLAGFDVALERANRLSARMVGHYHILEEQYNLPKLDTLPYALLPRRAELLELSDRYERFGKRLELAAYPQGILVRRAFLDLAEQVKQFMLETRKELEGWVEESMETMNRHLDRYHLQTEEKLEALESIVRSSENIQHRLHVLYGQEDRFLSQMDELHTLQETLAPDFGWHGEMWETLAFPQSASGKLPLS